MQEWIIQTISHYGYLGIVLLIIVENIFPPIPSELILIVGGFMTTYTSMTRNGVIFYATIGTLIGAFLLYSVGRFISPDKLECLIDSKMGHILFLKKEDIYHAKDWFNRKGKYTVLFCRCIPIMRSFISIPAGIAHMNLILFFIFTTIGSLVWNIILVSLGIAFHTSWNVVANGADTLSTIVTYIFLFTILINAAFFYLRRKKA